MSLLYYGKCKHCGECNLFDRNEEWTCRYCGKNILGGEDSE